MQFSAKTSTNLVVRDLGIPLVIGGLLLALRERLILKWCATTPTPCVPEAVNAFDRMVFQYGSIQADFSSNVFQNALIVILFFLPLLIAFFRRITWRQGVSDFFEFGALTAWNFALIEIVRSFVQRPRPLVYRSPLEDGANPNQYTSFYSGHTSFAALSTLTLYFYALRVAPEQKSLHRLLLVLALVLPAIMGSLRVWGGRHYPTDVIGGALFGWMLAVVYEKYRLKRSSPPLP